MKKINIALITGVLSCFCAGVSAQAVSKLPTLEELELLSMKEWNNQIRREKFDMVLPEAMQKYDVDMWIHVMRLAIPDEFGEQEFGGSSGIFVFTDRGGDRIERAAMGRRWGETQREREDQGYKLVEECGAYDIIDPAIFVRQPLASPTIEYDFRFKGLREFVEQRDPQRIALNFKLQLGKWETYTAFGGARDGISYTDYLLLADELGEKYTERLVSSEFVMMDYIINKVPSEIELLKKLRKQDVDRVMEKFASIVPGETKRRDVRLTVFRRCTTGVSQRGRSEGFGSEKIERGDIVASPSQGMFGYVLREGETEPPKEIRKLWAEYLRIDRILAENIKVGLTPRTIMQNVEQRLEEEGIVYRGDQLHMYIPKNNFPGYSEAYEPGKTHLAIDCHGMMKGARDRPEENYHGPRIGSNGPVWTWDIPLPPNHHFVLEYFFYMPSPAEEGKDQYLLWWNHEQALATENGVEYLSPPQKELYLIH